MFLYLLVVLGSLAISDAIPSRNIIIFCNNNGVPDAVNPIGGTYDIYDVLLRKLLHPDPDDDDDDYDEFTFVDNPDLEEANGVFTDIKTNKYVPSYEKNDGEGDVFIPSWRTKRATRYESSRRGSSGWGSSRWGRWPYYRSRPRYYRPKTKTTSSPRRRTHTVVRTFPLPRATQQANQRPTTQRTTQATTPAMPQSSENPSSKWDKFKAGARVIPSVARGINDVAVAAQNVDEVVRRFKTPRNQLYPPYPPQGGYGWYGSPQEPPPEENQQSKEEQNKEEKGVDESKQK